MLEERDVPVRGARGLVKLKEISSFLWSLSMSTRSGDTLQILIMEVFLRSRQAALSPRGFQASNKLLFGKHGRSAGGSQIKEHIPFLEMVLGSIFTEEKFMF